MERNEIEKVFKNYLPTTRAYRLALDKARQIEADVKSLKSMVITGMPRGSGVSDSVANAVCKLQDAADRVVAAANKCAEQIRLYERLLSLVSDPLAIEIIRLRYEQDVQFDYIPARIYRDRSTMFRHLTRAYEEISAKTKDATECD